LRQWKIFQAKKKHTKNKGTTNVKMLRVKKIATRKMTDGTGRRRGEASCVIFVLPEEAAKLAGTTRI